MPEHLHSFTLLREPRGASYRRLIDWAVQTCPEALLVLHEDMILSTSAHQVMSRLKPHLLRSNISSAWPGTVMMERSARVNYYRTSDMLGALFKDCAIGLYDWQHPELLEDLCFLRHDGSAVLTSIAHEHEAMLDLTADEMASFSDSLPDFALESR